ncbi:hypothetical protein WN944_001533 [Citrus x changshan-huyou]|uniref:Uncharacterized protein n=1 Tax=Citrus x changshan-huyou TaxID=2935761 RepID=A0AAP0QMS2_9ROSI
MVIQSVSDTHPNHQALFSSNGDLTFDKEKLLRLAEFYPKDFSAIDLIALEMQLDVYITDLRSSAEFSELKGIGELARTIVKTKEDKPLLNLFPESATDSGCLEILNTATTTSATAVTTASAKETATATTITHGLLHYLYTFVSLLTFNPFAKLTTDDFSAKTPSWTREFIGALGSYSFPSSPHTLKLRVHENVKRYARNYASLFILFFACSL